MESVVTIGLMNAALATLLAAAVWSIARWLRRPAVLHLLWFLVLVKLMTPPLLTVPVRMLTAAPEAAPTNQPPTLRLPSDRSNDAWPKALGLNGSERHDVPRRTQREALLAVHPVLQWYEVVFVAWALGTVGWSLIAATRIVRFHRALRAGEPATQELKAAVQRVAARLGLRRCPELRVIAAKIPPIVWPVGRTARLYLPCELASRLTPIQTELVLAHELAHLRRRDHLVRWFETLVRAIYWWLPTAWWAGRRLRTVAEECCDGLVVKTAPEHTRVYVESLLQVMDFLSGAAPSAPAPAMGIGSEGSLQRRCALLLRGETSLRLGWVGVTLLVLGLLVVPLSCSPAPETVVTAAGQPAPPSMGEVGDRPVTLADTILAVYVRGMGRQDSRNPLILAAWPDGTIVVSDDPIQGGPPYRQGTSDPTRLAALIARFESERLFAEQSLRHPNFGPDANYTTILVRHDGRELKLESWHELFERDGKLAASSRGVEALNGRRVADVLQADTTEYQRFRQVWDELRRDARSLVPAEMEPTTGLLHAENSELSWMDLTSLVEALEMIHAIGPWRIQPYLQAAVMLQSLTDQERIGMLRDWAGAHRDEQVIILCRMLFERAEGGEFRAPMLGAPSYLADTTAEDWPLEPIALVRDMPVLITPGYTLGGHAEPAGNYLDYCLELCHWSQRRFEVLDTTEIQQRLEELIAGDHWKRPLTDYEIRFLRSQAEPIPDYDTFVSLGVIDPEWAEHVTRLLDQNGIPNVVEGSVMYGVSVAPADAERALGILAADVRRNKYQATLLSLQQVREAAPPQEPVDQGAASSAAQLSAEVRQVLDGLQVGMDEADAVRHLKPVALDHGTTYFGGSGAKVLYYQLTLESQIGIRIGGSADPATFGKVVEIGRVERKTIWRRFEGDSIVFHQWNHIVNQRVALVGRIRSADKPLRPWMLTTVDGTVYVPGGPELAGVEQNARVIVKGVLRHEPGVRAPEGVAETPQAAPLPEYFYFDDDPPPEIRAGGWTLDELRPFLIAGVQYSTLVNQVGEEDLNPGRAVLRPVYFLGGKDSGRRLYLEFDNDRLRAAQVRDAESNELIEQLRLQDE